MHIFIVGFMGSGKTTVGRKLASRLNRYFIDLDQRIEKDEQMSIEELFEKKGESYFRRLEAQHLRDIRNIADAVVSTGGGAPCHSDNMAFMNETGITLYLKLSPGQLLARLRNSKGKRPLLKNKNEKEMLEYITKKLKEREPEYEKAQYIVEGFDQNIEKVIQKTGLNTQ